MNIDLNNYEEYFLMYADKELAESDQIMVEKFVVENPSLSEEFDQIRAAVLQPEKVFLIDKNLLKKNLEITSEEQLLNLYIDNELSILEKENLERRMVESTQLTDELNRYKATVSIPDYNIVFDKREKLYRHEKKVIPIYILRISVAAVILGMGIWIGSIFLSQNTDNNKGEFAKIQSTQIKSHIDKGQVPLEQNNVTPSQENLGSSNSVEDGTKAEKVNFDDAEQKEKPLVEQNNVALDNENIDKDITNNIIGTDKQDPAMLAQQLAVSDPAIPVKDEISKVSPSISTLMKPVSYVEQDVNNDDEDKSFPQKEFRKSKLSVFLKKVSRTVARNLKGSPND